MHARYELMRLYEWISLSYYMFFALLAWKRALPRGPRGIVTGIAAVGSVGILWAAFRSESSATVAFIRDWLPTALIPMAYWQTGLFPGPVHSTMQQILEKFDRRVFRSFPGLRNNFVLEVMYLFCYPLVPAGLAVLYFSGLRPFAMEYWNAVIPPAYLCYATFPFIRTLPPRALEHSEGKRDSKIRVVNLFVLRYVSIQANTFPSGHVAASVAVALQVIRSLPLVGALFLMVAVGIAFAAFAGRYHYAVDVLIGAGLALLALLIV